MRTPALTLHRFTLEAETITPLHIGAGGAPLILDYDAALWRGMLWVFDLDRVLSERMSLDDIAQGADPRISRLLRPEDYPQYARYRLLAPRNLDNPPQEILPLERNVQGHPYLPGSTLKGALRTALLYVVLRQQLREADEQFDQTPAATILQQALQSDGRPAKRKQFARNLEIAVFQRSPENQEAGFSPHHDLGRALRVSDSAPLDTHAKIRLESIGIFSPRNGRLERRNPTSRILLETIEAQTTVSLELSIDFGLFTSEDSLDPSLQSLLHPTRILRACRAFAYRLAVLEQRYAQSNSAQQIASFYIELANQIKQAPPNEAYIQLGWGTGWQAKTIGPLLELTPEGQEFKNKLVEKLALDRGHKSRPFPKTRRFVEQQGQPIMPLGWVRLRMPELAAHPAPFDNEDR